MIGKGAKPADIPLPIPVLRAVREAIGGRSTGPILRTRTGRRMDRAGASRALTGVARATGIDHPISPHGLRRAFCTTGLSIRDMQHAMRHAEPRRTLRYDMAKANLDRHAAHAVAAYLAGMSTGGRAGGHVKIDDPTGDAVRSCPPLITSPRSLMRWLSPPMSMPTVRSGGTPKTRSAP